MNRRSWALYLAQLAIATQWPASGWGQTLLQHDPFGVGVASGDPSPDGMVLWTRLLMQDPLASQPITVAWEIADDVHFRQIVRRGQTIAHSDTHYSVHVEVQGLQPQRWYYYRFMHHHAISPTGRTRTAPAPGDMPPHFRMGFASCQNWEQGYYAAWRHLAQEQPDLIVFLGDYIYEYAMPRNTTGLVRSHQLGHANTLADFRNRYTLYKSDPDLQAAHAACPWAVIWDDHEVQNDYAGDMLSGMLHPHLAVTAQAGWQAFYENMPLRASTWLRGVAPDNPAQRPWPLYRQLRWGRLANVHLLDTRQYRNLQACRSSTSRSAQAVSPAACPELADPARTLLGATQEQWLHAGLGQDTRTAPTQWSVLAQTTLFSPRNYPSGIVSTDTWDGYPAARQRLLASVAQQQPRNTVLLGGDIHQNYVCQVWGNAAIPPAKKASTRLLASEFCVTSISSKAGTTQAKVDAIRSHNPHIVMSACEQRGYGLADITPQQWTTHLRVIADAADPQSPVSTQASWIVLDQHAGPQKL